VARLAYLDVNVLEQLVAGSVAELTVAMTGRAVPDAKPHLLEGTT